MKFHRLFFTILFSLIAPLAIPAFAAEQAATHDPDGACCSTTQAAAHTPPAEVAPPKAWSKPIIATAASLPVQDAGRVKPLDTFARFTLLQLNGRRTATTHTGEKRQALPWLLDVLFYPDAAREYPVFLIQSAEVMDAVGLPHEKPRERFSYNALAPQRAQLFLLAKQYVEIQDRDRTAVQRQVLHLAHNVHLFETLATYLNFARRDYSLGSIEAATAMLEGAPQAPLSALLQAGPPFLEAVLMEAQQRGQMGSQPVLTLLQQIEAAATQASALALLPPAPYIADDKWHTPGELALHGLQELPPTPAQIASLRALEDMARAPDDRAAFLGALDKLHAAAEQQATARGEYRAIPLEVMLYRHQPFFAALVLYVIAFLLVALSWLAPRREWLRYLALIMICAPLALHIYGIALRCIIRLRPPVTTLYETLLFIGAVAVLVALVIELMNRRRVGLALAPILGALGLFLANKYEVVEGTDTMPNLIAVLDTNFWLSLHVITITIGYAAGLLAGAIAHLYILGKAFGFRKGDKTYYRNITRMTYGVLCFGLLFATVGTVLGGIWANDSWGRFWGWDPKENGALMIVLWGLAILHARMGGYIRDFGVNMAAVFGGIIVAFSWFGTNLLGVGLHSYGFTSGIHTALTTFYASQSAILALGALAWLREKVIVRVPLPAKPSAVTPADALPRRAETGPPPGQP